MLITEKYRALNAKLHVDNPHYGGGDIPEMVGLAINIAKSGVITVLDYGCGKGMFKKIAAQIAPHLQISEYDPSIPALAVTPQPVQFVVCRDVLEHVEEECINDVLTDIARCMTHAGYLNIGQSTSDDWLSDGTNAHCLIKNPGWWKEKLSQFFTITLWQHNKTVTEAGPQLSISEHLVVGITNHA